MDVEVMGGFHYVTSHVIDLKPSDGKVVAYSHALSVVWMACIVRYDRCTVNLLEAIGQSHPQTVLEQ